MPSRESKEIGFIVLITGLILILIYFLSSCQPRQQNAFTGIWTLKEQDQSLFGLKDYVLYLAPKRDKKDELQGYILASNDKCVIYDDIVDFIPLDPANQPNYDECRKFQIISYGSPILPLNVTIGLNKSKKVMEIKDQDVLLIRLQNISTNHTQA